MPGWGPFVNVTTRPVSWVSCKAVMKWSIPLYSCGGQLPGTGSLLLTGLVRCGRCRRAYVGMSAKGNGGTYHYYACSGRQTLGRKSCDGERLPKDKLETAILHQLTGLYRDGSMIRDAIEQAAGSGETDRAALTEKRALLAK